MQKEKKICNRYFEISYNAKQLLNGRYHCRSQQLKGNHRAHKFTKQNMSASSLIDCITKS